MKFFPRDESTIRAGAMLLGGLGLGAALMYVLDPERGKRRRALVRDKAVRVTKKTGDSFGARSRDWKNRAKGVAAEVKSLARREEVSDPVLEERVRAEIGRVVSTPGAIEVSATAGTVTLSGAVLASEVDDLVSAVRGVAGVEEVENRLEMHAAADDVPALQGARGPRSKAERGLESWDPAEAEI
ncbi:MAG: BON domain-containing protein [Acidobacteriota bacterium]|nr:BON domain-containing protein [Acidobacteriota bacterium]